MSRNYQTRRESRLLLGDESYEWEDQALCQWLPEDEKDDYFFNVDVEHDPRKIDRRIMCNACPVQQKCREKGDLISPTFGAWGGYTAAERRIQRRYRGKEITAAQVRAEYGSA